MKPSLTIFFTFIILASYAQVPERMSYQAVIRSSSNTILSNKNIGVKISIIQADTAGYPVYIETHNTNTNLNGLMTLQIGGGLNLFGNFSLIDWAAGPYFIKTETDPDGGFDYRIVGFTELLSVPYALFAAKSIFDTTSIYNSINKLELQSITNKNNIQTNLDSIQSKISLVDFTELIKSYQKIGKFVSAISLQGVDSFDVNINGNFIASKNVTIGGNIESLGSTSTLGTLEKPFKGLFISSGSLSIASDTLGKNIPAAVLSNVEGNLQISAGGLKLMGDNTSFIAPRIVSNLTGNATTATKLDTARKINGVAFDGTTDISITSTASNKLLFSNNGSGDTYGEFYNGSIAKTISYNTIGASPVGGSALISKVGTLTEGVIPFTLLSGTIPIWNQSTTGNAGTATKLATSKLINGVAFDGSSDITIATASANGLTYTNTGAGDTPGGSYDGSLAKTISYNSIGAVASNAAITGATKTKLTYDAKGLITAGADATTADIAPSANRNYVTDAQTGVLSNTSGINTGDQVLPTLVSLGAVASNVVITGATKTKLTYDAKGLVTAGTDATTADIAPSANRNYVTDAQTGVLSNTSGINTGDQVLPTLVSLGAVASNVAITGATKTKLTYDAKGLVISGADATTADIAASTNRNYVTDAQASVLSNTSGVNTGDESSATIKSKLGISTLSGSNTGDQVLPTLASLGAVASNAAITSATKTKLTYDAKGLVIAGADATTADIAASTNKNYVTDAQAGVLSNTSGINTGDQTNISGNAGTASKLATSKLINGVAFDGSSDITIATASVNGLTYTNTGAGDTPGGSYDGSLAKTISYNSIGAVASNLAITGATKTKLTYDAKGLVTAGADATTADIAPSANRNYVTDAQAGILSNTSGTNTGDETTGSIQTKLGITTLSGSNTGDQVLPTLVSLGAVASNTAITGATKTKLTYDAKGLITAGADATTADIAASTNRNYVTDTQAGVLSNTSGVNTGDQVLPTLVSLGAVGSNAAITGATKTKLTYDAKGLVTAGTDATTADIAPSANRNYVTDAQAGVLSNTSGTNTGDESSATIKSKLGISTISGSNTGDETTSTIQTKLGITTLSGSNTGDQVLPTLASLGAVASNAAITGATKTKLTYDAKGLVTAGTDATTADIAPSANRNYVTDAQVGVISNTSGINTGDETTGTIQTKLGITTLSGSNTGDQVLPTLSSLGAVAGNTLITGATKTKLTYDTKGLVTAGVDATTADIAPSANRNYVTDIQVGVISNTSGINTGDETTSTIKTKLGITTLSGSNTGDQVLPTLSSLGAVAGNTLITGATKTKLTYDAKGLVTAGADATTADIAASANRNYVTDAQAGVLSNTSGVNTGDESSATIKSKLGISTLSGSNTGDETTGTIQTKLGITTLSGSNTGDQVLPTLSSLGAVAGNTLITGATKTKLTYDTKGLVTAGADATTADVAPSANRNYVTDIQSSVLSNTSGINTGDETTSTIQTKLGITTLSGSNTGDQVLPTLSSLGAVASNAAITGATKTKLTYDAKGLITAGADATTADIAASTNRNYVTDAQAGVLSNTSGTNTGDETTSTIKTKLGITTLSGSNTGDQTITLTGDVTGTGTGTFTSSLSNTTVTAASYGSSTAIPTFTVDGKGRLTAAANTTIIADAGTLSGTTLKSTIVNSSLTSIGTLTTGVWSATTIDIAHGGTNTTATPTSGGIVYGTGAAQAYSAAGTSGQFLQSAGAGTPVWVAQPGPTSVVVLTSLTPSSTYNVSAGVKAIMVELIGGGGGSGAIIATTGAGKGSVSGGGGSGSYNRLLIINPASSYIYTIGAGGIAGTAGGAGGTGGQTLFNGTSVTTFGGVGGAGCTAAAATIVSLGGVGGAIGANGNFSVPGSAGGTGYVAGLISVCGAGANSILGGGALGSATLSTLILASTAVPTAYGAGASGIGVYAAAVTSANGTGAAGYQGVIIITEFK